MNKTEDFIAYEKPIAIDSKLFRTDGYYVPVGSKYHALCFFENGLMKSHVTWVDRDFWEDPDEKVKDFYRPQMLNTQESYGAYYVNGDTLTFQFFNRTNVEVYARSVNTTKGWIINDTTLKIFSEKAFLDSSDAPDELLEEPVLLRFYPSTIKPDSTQAWFLTTSWYKKKAHPSRN
ncbi:hypothetical protein ACJD0Z_06780 [Flavobacteriaceae bacterium M23B6Z8]